MKNVTNVFILTFILFFAGCSGKVQTNPITKDNVYNLPKIKEYNNVISNDYIVDFRNYANQKFRVEKCNVIQANKKVEMNNNNENRLWNNGYKATK